jgi:glucose/arabinose dehydrogenase
MKSNTRLPLVLFATLLCACSASAPPEAAVGDEADASGLAVPLSPGSLDSTRIRVATGLENPRGMLPAGDGSLLVAVAGTGDPERPPTGALLKLMDNNEDGDFNDYGERIEIIGDQSSLNILDIVQRDEVFGMAAVAGGGGTTIVSHALFQGVSTVYRVEGERFEAWSRVHGNLNDFAYDDYRERWFAVSSSSDEVIRLTSEGEGVRVLKFPPLSQGQDAVPGYIEVDPDSGHLFVSLFSGSPLGESAGTGIELVKRSGAIVRIDPDNPEVTWVVSGLTAPTDFTVDANGRLYVLELCDEFLDPVSDYADLRKHDGHGGFRRFSGRLLRIDPATNEVEIVAEGLDTPTNLALGDRGVYIAQGMGTPGRTIPTAGGGAPLDGFIELVNLPD